MIVDLDAIKANAGCLLRHLSNGTQLMAVVKADGYGHGGSQVARAAVLGGASWLGVATVEEGIELRTSGLDVPVLILGPVSPSEFPVAQSNELDITVGSLTQVEALKEMTLSNRLPLRVQVKANTGMNRFSLVPNAVETAVAELLRDDRVILTGIYTHFARSDEADRQSTDAQLARFKNVLASLQDLGVTLGLVHASNSGGILASREYDFSMVRAGISLYGVPPGPDRPLFEDMRSALRVEARVQRVEWVEPGDEIGYGGTYIVQRPTRIVLLGLGYADGYPRSLSNLGWVSIRDQRCQVAGRVSMDQMSVELPPELACEVGDIACVIGNAIENEPSVEYLAALAKTIPYEILTGLGNRLPVVYHRNGEVVAFNNVACSL
ncbi:alanine racemase [soil metagenome]